MRALSLLLFIFTITFYSSSFYSQSSPQPTPPGSGSNSTYYDTSNNAYIFKYDNGGEKLRYTYSLHSDSGLACLKALRVRVNSSYNFWPSYGGGIAWLHSSDTIWSWEPEADHTLLGHSISGNVVTLRWVTETPSSTRDPYLFYYKYILKIEGRTLVMDVIQDSSTSGNSAVHFNLDRCEDVVSPVIIGVPYLTLFNLLYCDNSTGANKVFTSMFFDWDSTGCSRLEPQNLHFSSTSKRYSQFAVYNPKTNSVRNPLDEKIYLTVSPELEETLPNISADVSANRDESVERFVWDQWGTTKDGFDRLSLLDKSNIDNLWVIHHFWQQYGYDVKFPDTYPANPCTGYGFGTYIDSLSSLANNRGDLFSLHENYVDYHTDAPSFNAFYVSKKSDGNPVISYIFESNRTDYTSCSPVVMNCSTVNCSTDVLKTTLLNNFYSISEDINSTYNTNASYLDVHSSYDPSVYVDYDHNQSGAGRFTTVLANNRQIGKDMSWIHSGPVSGEGLAHFLYAGYYDDFEAQIHTAQSLPGMHYFHTNSIEQFGGYYKPLLVHFGLNKIRPKTFSHGVGYAERFFYNTVYEKYKGRSLDSMLRLQATVLAYGHGAWMNGLDNNVEWNDTTYAKIVRDHIYPMQELYGNTGVSSITYNDNGTMRTVSEYIK